ncbi:hypothetical protein M422DRAFT_259623 [Sphaerobolus stellatus SS14]|uniref:DNA helicase Pif1-like 2B domain-containing protein n=1 Tax=Sphaerobolus stellatus (strain SS14) TaxID=990650 RepID=A0A0C9V8D6_SPHS4|nr:hypothetical protein M422DRAFT_259623 [Sphaerobolus stellatus SS14]
MVSEYNLHALAMLGNPVVCIRAKHNYTKAKKAPEEDADGLEKQVLLAEGACVMITRNLWTSKGLVNGAHGIVMKIWYKPGADPKVNLLAVVFV